VRFWTRDGCARAVTAMLLASTIIGCSSGKGRAGSEQAAAEQALTASSGVVEKKAKAQALRQWPELLTAEAVCTLQSRRVQLVSDRRAAFAVTYQCSITSRPPDGKQRVGESTVSGELEKSESGWILGSFS
jgi:hypothetical protein